MDAFYLPNSSVGVLLEAVYRWRAANTFFEMSKPLCQRTSILTSYSWMDRSKYNLRVVGFVPCIAL